MLRSRLHSKFRKKNVSNCTISNKILWATLLRKAKINYHEELDNRILNNNRKFNSFFSSMVDNLKIEYDIDRQANQLIQTLSCGQ